MKLKFNVDKAFDAGIQRLAEILGYEQSTDGITVTAVEGERIGVSLKDSCATIYYNKKHYFYRALGLLVENAKKSSAFDITEDSHFTMLGVMIDTSRCGVPTVDSLKRMIDFLAVMGYNMAMLYTEDTVELEGRPYFGYMRGRYTREELVAVDDYAYEYGIEVIPCIECYGHMEKYLFWPEAGDIKDTSGVLLAREEKTFEFVEQLISTVSSCFRSKRIHIGMDEAWDMGRGAFLDKNGYVPPFDIFNEFMDGLIAITNKYGLTPMMWSDMYFRISNNNNDLYYEESTVVPDDVKAKIPKEVELVFWHYGEKHECDDYMLKKHNELGRKVIFAGGLWSWIGHFPEHNYAYETTKFSLDACRNNNVREAMTTIWSNDNAESDLFADLFGLSFTAELAYDKDADKEKQKARFEACTGANYDAFYTMSLYHNKFDGVEYPKYSHRFLGKPLFWQDIMEGLYDTHLFERPMSGHYKACAEKMRAYLGGKWNYLTEYAYRVFDYLATKTEIAENLVPAYKRGDKEMLRKISCELLPLLKEKTDAVHEIHKAAWFKNNKIVGWQNLDVRYGGVRARCDTAKYLIDLYLDGKCDSIEELEVERLHKNLSGFVHYSYIATPNLKT